MCVGDGCCFFSGKGNSTQSETAGEEGAGAGLGGSHGSWNSSVGSAVLWWDSNSVLYLLACKNKNNNWSKIKHKVRS